jgi:predicted nucleic acid-binding protein
MVEVSEPPTVPDCRDPKDRPFLELASFARADALVTGDADLLALTPLFSIPIITATALRGRLAGAN